MKFKDFQEYAYFVVNTCVPGRSAKYRLDLRRNPTGGGRGVTTAPPCGPREITYVVPEKLVFVEDFRVPETEIPKVQWGGSRASILAGLKSGYCLARHSAPSLLRMLDGVPRRISLGFAHSAAAAGCRRGKGRFAASTCSELRLHFRQ